MAPKVTVITPPARASDAGDTWITVLAEVRELATAVARIEAQLGTLRRDLAVRRSGAAPLNRADRARLARMLPAIAGVYGSDAFAARDLLDAEAPAALRLVTRGLDARWIGSLLARGAGQVIDGYIIERAGDELHVRLWRVFRSGGPASDDGSPRPSTDRV